MYDGPLYDGPLYDVTLHCENDMMKHLIDRFGEGVRTSIVGDNHFKAYVSVPASPTFFAWVFTFGGRMKIVEPEDVVESYREMLKAAMG